MANEVVEPAAAEAEGEQGGGNWSVFTNMMMIMLVMQLVKFNKPDAPAGSSNVTHAIEQQLMALNDTEITRRFEQLEITRRSQQV